MIRLYKVFSLLSLVSFPFAALKKTVSTFNFYDVNLVMSEDYYTLNFRINGFDSEEMVSVYINSSVYKGIFDTSSYASIQIPAYEFSGNDTLSLNFDKYNISYYLDVISDKEETLAEDGIINFSRIVPQNEEIIPLEKRKISYMIPEIIYCDNLYLNLNESFLFYGFEEADLSDYDLFIYIDEKICSYPYEKEDGFYKIPLECNYKNGKYALSLRDRLYINSGDNSMSFESLNRISSENMIYLSKNIRSGDFYSYIIFESKDDYGLNFKGEFSLNLKKEIKYPGDIFRYL